MSLKVFEKKTYQEYQQEISSKKEQEKLRKYAVAESLFAAERASVRRKNAFLVLTMILLGTSLVLGIHLFLVMSRDAHLDSNGLPASTLPVEVEIIQMPRYEEADAGSLPVWECSDGSFVSSEKNPGSCQKVEAGANKLGDGNRFFNPPTSFGR